MSDDLTLYSGLVSLAVPWLTAVVSQRKWSSTVTWLIFAAFSVAATAFSVYLKGQWNSDDLVHSLLVVLAGASASYQLWKPTLHEVEAATSGGGAN
jgi:hypothetical protein